MQLKTASVPVGVSSSGRSGSIYINLFGAVASKVQQCSPGEDLHFRVGVDSDTHVNATELCRSFLILLTDWLPSRHFKYAAMKEVSGDLPLKESFLMGSKMEPCSFLNLT